MIAGGPHATSYQDEITRLLSRQDGNLAPGDIEMAFFNTRLVWKWSNNGVKAQ
jgi:hypothetical protein